jgi:nucleotide-binding universal stress UspA family protein
MAKDPGVRRIVVGVDGSAESVAALRWACREASLRAAEVHAVLALESACHQVASYAAPAPRQTSGSWGAAREVLRRSVSEAVSLYPNVSVRTEITEGLAARVLLDHAHEADMLVLGRTAHGPDPYRGGGPVLRVPRCYHRSGDDHTGPGRSRARVVAAPPVVPGRGPVAAGVASRS